MKLATTTCDFHDYTGSQIKSLQLIREAGFCYADNSWRPAIGVLPAENLARDCAYMLEKYPEN